MPLLSRKYSLRDFNPWGALGIALVALFGLGSLWIWLWALLTFFQHGGVP